MRHYVGVQLALSAAFLFGSHAAGKAVWPQLLSLFGGERGLFCWGTFALHMSLLFTLNGALAVLYMARLPAVEACKISPKLWPWRSPNADERARFWRSTAASLATVAFNNVAVALPSTFSTYDLVAPYGMLPAAAAAFPALATVVWQVAVCAVVEDVLFYHFHRFLHTPAIYGYVHKWHHQWSHSVRAASRRGAARRRRRRGRALCRCFTAPATPPPLHTHTHTHTHRACRRPARADRHRLGDGAPGRVLPGQPRARARRPAPPPRAHLYVLGVAHGAHL